MRESWWLWKIDERVDAQRRLLKQRVRPCNAISRLHAYLYIYRLELTVVVHLEACIVAIGVVDSSRRDIASLAR